MDQEAACSLWDLLLEAGDPRGLVPAGMLALDRARVEAGFPLIDVDFWNADFALTDQQKSTPYELGLGWAVSAKKEPFVGREALMAERARGPERFFVGIETSIMELDRLFALDDLAPEVCDEVNRDGVPVYSGGEQVGRATSVAWSPLLKRQLALATVNRGYEAPGTPLDIEVTVEYTRRRARSRVAPLPFFDPPRKRATPAGGMTTASPGAASRRVPANAWTLPARYYCDPAVFELEGERIHRALWNAACPVEELAEPGDYRLVEIAGDSVIVVRDQEGVVRAHHNVCRHRGTRLLEAEEGCLAGSIQCPYHAWTYGLDGQLRRAPHMDEVEGFSVSDFRLAEAACEEWGGIVFVRVAEDGPDLTEQMGPAGARMGIWGLADLRSAHTESYDVKANWKLIIQNFAECLHCPVIHPQLARLSHYLSGENYPADPNAIGAAMDLEEGIETLSTDGRLVGAPLPGLPAEFRRRVGYEILLPNALFCLHPDFVIRYLMRPVGVGRTSIRCDWLFSEEALSTEGFDASRAVEFWDETNRQDWHVSELSQKGIGSSAYQPGPYSNREDHLWQIDRLILDRLGEA